MCPLAWLVEEGVPFALHSDFTMAPAQPLLLAWSAVNRSTVNGNVTRPGTVLSRIYKKNFNHIQLDTIRMTLRFDE